jgi:DNA-binding CsgD family transcriptional regulator
MQEEPAREFSESRFVALVEAVFDVYYDWYMQTGDVEFSSQIEELLRLEPGSLPRTFDSWLERLHPEDRKHTLQENRRVAFEGGVFAGEYRLRRGDGSYVLVRDRGVMLKDDQGRPTHMIGVIRDISREREAELAQREAAELYGTLFAQTVNPAYHIADDGFFLDANCAGLTFLQTDRRQLLRGTVLSLWGEAAAVAVREAASPDGAVATLALELQVGDVLKALVVTLVPCRFRGAATCFALGTDVSEHKALQRALVASEESLRRQAAALEDANTALRVILDERNRQSAQLEWTILHNAETMILPLLEKLGRHLESTPEAIYVDAATKNLRELVFPFAQALDAPAGTQAQLTMREREIANLIRAGKSSSEIAEALYISLNTVAFHRKSLRRKLGVQPRGKSLAAYLARPPGGAESEKRS